MAETASSSVSTRKPEVPSAMSSGMEPRGMAMTGVPVAMDSRTVMPNGSSPWRGKRKPFAWETKLSTSEFGISAV